MNQNDLVSVVIPTYNCASYISDAIESVLHQTYLSVEIIVVNDGSTDTTEDVLKKYRGRIRSFRIENSGPAMARNVGIENSYGGYIAFLDADDLWVKTKIERCINFIKDRGYDWICTGLKKIMMDGDVIEERGMDENRYGYDKKTGKVFDLKKGLFYYKYGLPLHAPTMVIKKGCFQNVGLFDVDLKICEDTDLMIRLEEAGFQGGFLNEMLTIYRFRPGSITKNKNTDGLFEHQKVGKKYVKKLGLNNATVRKDYANLLWDLAARYYLRNNILKALLLSIQSLYFYPNRRKISKFIKYILKKE